MVSDKNLVALNKLLIDTKNYRSYKNVPKDVKRKLEYYFSRVDGEKTTIKDAMDGHKTLHSTIKDYINRERVLYNNKVAFVENYKYELNFLKRAINSNLAEIRRLDRQQGKDVLISEKMKLVKIWLDNATDYNRLVTGDGEVFGKKHITGITPPVANIMWNKIIKSDNGRINSTKQLIEYFGDLNNIDKEDISEFVSMKSGNKSSIVNLSEIVRVNNDTGIFINSFLSEIADLHLRTNEIFTVPLKDIAKTSIDMLLFWDLVNKYKRTTAEVGVLTDYKKLLEFMVNNLGVYGFSAFFLQRKYIDNIINITPSQ